MIDFRTALDRLLTAQGLPLRQVCKGAGVSYEAMRKVMQGKTRTPNVEDAIAVAGFFGLTVEQMMGSELPDDLLNAIATWRALSDDERRLLRDLERGRRARDPEA